MNTIINGKQKGVEKAMVAIGIIAEYNPFHNGHMYQIQEIKKQTHADHIVVVMSGNFVQRGTPAWTDKYLRAQMALAGGADLIFELPVCYAVSSAEQFALAGVSLLSSLGFVDGICFGSECGDLPLLQRIAAFLAEPPESFHEQMKLLTAQGLSYPSARQQALLQYFPEEASGWETALSMPNNILAIEYLKALQTLKSPLTPYTIKRNDAGYHSGTPTANFASAEAIRKQSMENTDFLTAIRPFLPTENFSLLTGQRTRFPITENDFSDVLYYRLSCMTEEDRMILDMTPEIFSRIRNKRKDFSNYTSFITSIKTKQYTYSRISRVLLHMLLNIRQETYAKPAAAAREKTADASSHANSLSRGKTELPIVPYAKLLGFSKKTSSLLRRETHLPIITKPADGIRQICSYYGNLPKDDLSSACRLYEKDIFAADLYTQVQNTKGNIQLLREYQQKPAIQQP